MWQQQKQEKTAGGGKPTVAVLRDMQGRIRPLPRDPSVDTDGVGPTVWTTSTQLLLSGHGERTT